MIANELHTRIESIIDKILLSKVPFHLTGSRFFGNEVLGSDWDFFVDSGPGLKKLLKGWNFLRQRGYYGEGMGHSKPEEFVMDPCMASAWEYWKGDSERIHIQVIKPKMMWLKIKAQGIIKSQNLMRLAPRNIGPPYTLDTVAYKLLSRAIWISVMRAVQDCTAQKTSAAWSHSFQVRSLWDLLAE